MQLLMCCDWLFNMLPGGCYGDLNCLCVVMQSGCGIVRLVAKVFLNKCFLEVAIMLLSEVLNGFYCVAEVFRMVWMLM